MNGTNATTFCEIEEKRQLRSRHGPIQQKRFNILISIKNDLFRCRQNILTITKVEMKALRRKLYEIMHENIPLTIKENEIFQECKTTINKLRVSHPELFEVKKNSRIQMSSTDSAVLSYNDFATETSDNNTHSKIENAKVKIQSEPKQKIQKLSTDLAVHNSRIDSLDTNAGSTSEAEINNKILEVCRQAKEIIEYYYNQQDATTLPLYRS